MIASAPSQLRYLQSLAKGSAKPCSELADRPVPVRMLAVDKISMSGTGDELRDFAGISAAAIVRTVQSLVTEEATNA